MTGSQPIADDRLVPILEVTDLLANFRRPWFLAGGWAIDLFLGEVTRHHDDVDVAILRRDQSELRRHLAGWEFVKVVNGRRERSPDGEWIGAPIHEIYARQSVGAPGEFEVLLNEARDGTWVFRRDPRITRPISTIRIVGTFGVPFLGPEVVLLYKAKNPGTKDLEDFERALPRLGVERRDWLRNALLACHPGHSWIARL